MTHGLLLAALHLGGTDVANFFRGIHKADDTRGALAVISGLTDLDISDAYNPARQPQDDGDMTGIVACLMRLATSMRSFRAHGIRELAAQNGKRDQLSGCLNACRRCCQLGWSHTTVGCR